MNEMPPEVLNGVILISFALNNKSKLSGKKQVKRNLYSSSISFKKTPNGKGQPRYHSSHFLYAAFMERVLCCDCAKVCFLIWELHAFWANHSFVDASQGRNALIQIT